MTGTGRGPGYGVYGFNQLQWEMGCNNHGGVDRLEMNDITYNLSCLYRCWLAIALGVLTTCDDAHAL